MRISIALKTVFFLLPAFLIVSAGTIFYTQRAMVQQQLYQSHNSLTAMSTALDESINSLANLPNDPAQTRSLDMMAMHNASRIIISDLKGKIYYDSKRIRLGLSLSSRDEMKISPRAPKGKFLIRTTDNLKSVYYEQGSLSQFADRLEDISLVYFAPLHNESKVAGQIMIIEPMSQLGPSIDHARGNLMAFLAIVFGIITAAIYFAVQRSISKPLFLLTGMTKKIAQKDMKDRLDFHSNDEIGYLGRNFNTMVYNLEKMIREIEEQNDGLMHLSGELEARNQELHHKQQLIEYDLRLAHNIQQELLPQVYPKIEGVQISAANFQVGEIGGDCFDFYKLGEKYLGAFIGDVSGKGIAAALVMSMVTILFSQLKDRFASPAKILGHVNDIMYRHFGSQHSIYLTCFFMTLDTETMTLSYSCAGHTPPILFRQETEEMIELEAEGFGLGMFNNVVYEEKTMRVHPGDKVILYTDGVTDCRNQTGDMFGHERLIELIKANPKANSYRLTHFIVEELEEFAGKAARQDDLTLLVIEMQEPPHAAS
ncbi:MAG: SpoIIE family protein phosphatase [bacterium]